MIVKLAIPAAAKRSRVWPQVRGAEFADVLEVIGASSGVSSHDDKTEYRVGCRVAANHFDDNWQEECAGGIHFYYPRRSGKTINGYRRYAKSAIRSRRARKMNREVIMLTNATRTSCPVAGITNNNAPAQ